MTGDTPAFAFQGNPSFQNGIWKGKERLEALSVLGSIPDILPHTVLPPPTAMDSPLIDSLAKLR